MWSLHVVSLDAHKDGPSSSSAVAKIDPPSFPSTPALALKGALLASGAPPPQSLYAVSKDCIGKGSYGSVWSAVGPKQESVAIKSFVHKPEALVELTAYSSLQPHPNVIKLLDVVALSNNRRL